MLLICVTVKTRAGQRGAANAHEAGGVDCCDYIHGRCGAEKRMIYRSLRIRSLNDALIGGIAVVVIGFIAYEFFAFGFYQPRVIQRGSVVAYNGINRGEKVTAQTRLVQVGRRTFWQVEVSPGDWQDCGSDCAAVLRRFVFRD